MSPNKATLRASIHQWRRERSTRELSAWSAAITQHLLAWPALMQSSAVGAYAALAREPAMDRLLCALLERGILVALPLVQDSWSCWRQIGSLADIIRAPGQIPGPSGTAPAVDPHCLQCVLVPGLAFDRQGHRLGRGGGHYDRLLSAVSDNCMRIGVCFSGQLLREIPTDPWDVVMHAVVTEDGIGTCTHR